VTLPCTAPTLPKLLRLSYAWWAVPAVTKGHSGQLNDDRCLPVP
jgi:hypothetical protein